MKLVMKLIDYLKIKNLSEKQFSELLGCTETAVYYWATGQRRPNGKNMLRISEVTGGKVTPNDFHQIAAEVLHG